ncbi:MAG: PHP domain-containing protein [Planctomycetota bacterium]|jgi:hypothetical protein
MAELSMDDLQPVRGAIHIHTDYNDGDAPMADVVAAAESARLDYFIVTDHHHAYAARHGWGGREKTDSLLVVVGTEYRTKERHDILGLGPTTTVATRTQSSEEALRLLAQMNAATFLAHPQGHRHPLFCKLHPWQAWDLKYYDGIEIWCYMHDWIRSLSLRTLPQMCRTPASYIQGPDEAILKHWDQQAEKRRVAGIGALDVHGRKLPLGLSHILPWARHGILPYEPCFRAFGHYTLVPREWGHHDAADREALLRSLKAGAGWVCHDELADGRDFLFLLEENDTLYPLGSERPFQSGQRLHISVPRSGEIRLRCRGITVAEKTGLDLEVEIKSAGEYRVEVQLEGRPWIYSNHIYLREG